MSQRPSSAHVNGVAVLDGLACAVLVRAVGDWRRSVPPGTRLEDVRRVEEAFGAMRDAAAGWYGGVQAARLASDPGSGETQGKSAGSSLDPWETTTKEAASLLGVSTRRVRQLASERKLESQMVDGRMYFRLSQVLRLQAMRAT